MKLSKRLLSALLLVVFIIANMAVPTFAATFTDVPKTDAAYNAVTVLSKLGVINGYDDGTFLPEKNVTRAEFTAMLMRVRGLGNAGNTSIENPPFSDVTTDDVKWAIGNIRTAHEMGIINGYEDGTFKPKKDVKYEEAVKMIVCALGYEFYGVDGGQWYTRYITTANTLGFLNNAGGAIGTPATRSTIARMLYNCLEVEIAEDNEVTEKTILENDLKLIKKVGFIASNAETSLTAPNSSIKNDEIQINAPDEKGVYRTETYKVENAEEFKDMLGTQITFYYQDDRTTGIKTVIQADVKHSTSVVIEADDMVPSQSDANKITYYKENASNTSTIRMNPNGIVIYNDKLYGANEAGSTVSVYFAEMGAKAVPTLGNMRFLDREGDGTYDIIFVESYVPYFVSSFTSSNYTIVDDKVLSTEQRTLKLDPKSSDSISFVDDAGKEVAFSAIRKGSIVCLKESNSANGGLWKRTAVITNKSVNGTVKGVKSGKAITVNSTDYEFSSAAPWMLGMSGALETPKMGDTCTYYLDMTGKVIAYDKTEAASNQLYGFIIAKSDSRDRNPLNETVIKLQILTQSGSKNEYKIIENTRVNGTAPGSFDAIVDALKRAKTDKTGFTGMVDDNDVSQVIKYTTTTYKGETVIDEIVTVTDKTNVSAGNKIESDKLYYYTALGGNTELDYNAGSSNLVASGQTRGVRVTDATVFYVGTDISDVTAIKKLSTSAFSFDGKYKVEFYDVSTSNSAKVIVIYENSKPQNDLVSTNMTMFVTDITNDGNYQLEGYVNGSSSKTTITGSDKSDSAFAAVQIGDVIRLVKDDEDNSMYVLDEKEIVFSVENDFRKNVTVSYDGSEHTVGSGIYLDLDDNLSTKISKSAGYSMDSTTSALYRAIWGSVYMNDVSASWIGISSTNPPSDSEVIEIPREKFRNAAIFNIDLSDANWDSEDTLVPIDAAENEGALEMLNDINASDAPSEVFVLMSGTNVKMLIIVER